MKALNSIGPIDAIVGPLMILIILLLAYNRGRRKGKEEEIYKYFFRGAVIKILGTLAFCGIYIFYFRGGDTFDYHQNASALVNLMFKDFGNYIDVMLSSKEEYLSYFDSETGYLNNRHFLDTTTFNVSRILMFAELVCFKSYIGASVLVSYLSYLGIWRIFKLFHHYGKGYERGLFYLVLVVPSVIFWSGGLSKEVLIMGILGNLLWAYYKVFVKFERGIVQILVLLFLTYVMISIKPYVFIALFPSCILWASMRRVVLIKSTFIRVLVLPAILFVGLGLSIGVWTVASSSLGEYSSVDGIIEKAVVSQEDLQNERYQGSSFDIGKIEPTPIGVLKKFPQATIAGMFRPFVFEARNFVMIFSGLENLVLLMFFAIMIFRFRRMIVILVNNEFLVFCMLFSVIFAFAVGLSTSNFGALVRFKIPMLPFFAGALYLLSRKTNTVAN